MYIIKQISSENFGGRVERSIVKISCLGDKSLLKFEDFVETKTIL